MEADAGASPRTLAKRPLDGAHEALRTANRAYALCVRELLEAEAALSAGTRDGGPAVVERAERAREAVRRAGDALAEAGMALREVRASAPDASSW